MVKRLVAAIWSGLVLLAIVLGLPWALITFTGSPFPHHLPAQQYLHEWIISGGLLLVWMLWAALVAGIGLEMSRVVRRMRVPQIRLADPPQGILAGLVGAVVLASTTAASRGAVSVPPPPPTATAMPQPPAPSSTSAPAPGPGTVTLVVAGQHYSYTVHRGDTLSHIAAQWLGDPDRWPEIYHLNKGRHFPTVGGTLTNPNLIYPGWVLTLPDDAHPPTTPNPVLPAAPANPPPVHPSAPSSTPPASSTSPTATSPTPAPASPTPSTTPGPASASATPDRAQARQDSGSGVELPGGGWVAAPLAAAITAAAALIWIGRRRRYQPHPPTGPDRIDPDLIPLPVTVAVVHAGAPRPDREESMDEPSPDILEATTITPTVLGERDGQPIPLGDLPALGVGLTGPAAHDAARGVLVAGLAAGGPWAAEHEATILTTTADLDTLLGHDTQQRPVDRLQLEDTIEQALNRLEGHLLHRARLAAERDDNPTDEADQQPPVILLTHTPVGAVATRLQAILTVGSRLGLAAILIGAWSPEQTWHVDLDGTTTQAGGDPVGRLNVLDFAAAKDILATLAEAQPADAPPGPQPPVPTSSAVAQPDSSRGDQTSPATGTRPVGPQPASDDVPTALEPSLHLTLLGSPTLHIAAEDGTTTEVHIRRTDGLAILTYLAVTPTGATSDQIMAELWPETRPRHARGRFHTTISETRKTLTEALGTDPITRIDNRYRLDPNHVQTDVWQLTAAVHDAATTLNPDHQHHALHRIIELHTAPLADGYSWLWLLPHREALRRHVLDAYTTLADTEPDPHTALELIQAAIRQDPYNEDLYQRAMRLHAKLRNPDGVKHTLRAIAGRLAEIETEVSHATRETANELLNRLQKAQRQ